MRYSLPQGASAGLHASPELFRDQHPYFWVLLGFVRLLLLVTTSMEAGYAQEKK